MSSDVLLDALRQGASEEQVAAEVAHAAALRVARFHTSNEFGDWDTALHTFTFANAVHQGLRRSPSQETSFAWKIAGASTSTPQVGGILVRGGDDELYTLHKVWRIEHSKEVKL